MTSNLTGRVNSLSMVVERVLSLHVAAQHEYDTAQAAAITADDHNHDVVHAHAVVIDLATHVQQTAHKQVADIVSQCLAAVFDDPYEFCITFTRKRRTTEATITFEREGNSLPPLRASGGGVVDVAAFALRAAAIALQRPRVRRLMVLDEPFKFVSADYQPRVADMLQQLSDDLDFQFIMVTHIDALVAGTVVRL